MNAANGFSTTYWGPHLWRVMHLVSLNYPLRPTRQDALTYRRFFVSLADIIPCRSCRTEYTKMITRTHPLRPELFVQGPRDRPGSARTRLSSYIFTLHAAVNARLGKKPGKTNWRRYYEAMRTRG